MAQWVLSYTFQRPVTESCLDVRHQDVAFEYGITCVGKEKKDSFLADRLLADLKGLFKLYQHAISVDGYLKGTLDFLYLFCYFPGFVITMQSYCHNQP